MIRLLLDECLSPTLVARAQARGVDAALDFVGGLDHTINRVVEVHSPTDIRLSNLPPDEPR
jgi:hypothetical protein